MAELTLLSPSPASHPAAGGKGRYGTSCACWKQGSRRRAQRLHEFRGPLLVSPRRIFSNATRTMRWKKREHAPSGAASAACESVCWRKPTRCERSDVQIETSLQGSSGTLVTPVLWCSPQA